MNRHIFQTEYVRYEVTATGYNARLLDRSSEVDYCRRPGWYPFASFGAGPEGAPTGLTRKGNVLTISFKKPGARAVLEVTEKPHYLVFELKELAGIDAPVFDLASLGVPAADHVGHHLNIVWNPAFAVCLLALDLKTQAVCDVMHEPVVTRPVLRIRTHAALGQVGRKYALIAAPRAAVENVIVEAARDYGLPAPTDENGVPMKKSYRKERSYVFLCHVDQGNQDYALEIAQKGGFGLLMSSCTYTFGTVGSYRPHREHWPGGAEAFQAWSKRFHAAGIMTGIHSMSSCVGPDDPLFAAGRGNGFTSDGGNVLAADVEASDEVFPVILAPFGPLASGIFRIGEELVVAGRAGAWTQIYERPEAGDASRPKAGPGGHVLAGIKRGAYGTRPAAHAKGTPLVHFRMVYSPTPDPTGPVFEQVARNIADAVNRYNLDMLYFDGLCGTADPGLDWYDACRFTYRVYELLDRKNVIMEASDSFHHFWHLHTRAVSGDAAPPFDETSLEHVRAKELWRDWMPDAQANLLPSVFDWHGWYAYDANIPSGYQLKPTPATTLDEWRVYLEAARRLDIPIGVQTSVEDCRNNPATGEMLKMTREFEQERITRFFGKSAVGIKL